MIVMTWIRYEFQGIIERTYKGHDDIIGLDLLSTENEYVRNLESYIDIYVIRKNKVTRVFKKDIYVYSRYLFINTSL